MNPRSGVLSMLLVLLLAGCAVGPDSPAPRVNESQAFLQQDRWWVSLHDPLIDEWVARALQSGPDMALAEARVREGRALLAMNGASRLPQLSAGARSSRDHLSRNGESFANIPFANPAIAFTDYRLGFDASWEIDLFGHTARSVEAADARLASREAARNDAALRLAAEVARTVIDIRTLTLRLALARQRAAIQQDIVRLTGVQRDAGWVSDSEVAQAEAAREDSLALLPPLASARAGSLAALSVLVDVPLATLDARFATVQAVPPAVITPLASLPSDLLLRRPDVRQAERELAAATADIGVAVAEQYPRLSLVGSAGWDSIEPGGLTAAASRFWSIGPQLSLPLLAGGRLKAQLAAREAGRDVALAGYRKAVLGAFADVDSAMLRYREALNSHAVQAAALQARQHQYDLVAQRVKAGDAGQLELLASAGQRDMARDALLSAEQQLATCLVALHKALGGGFA